MEPLLVRRGMNTAHTNTTHTLFVIDDDQDMLDLLEGFFRPRGILMKPFPNAESALAELQADPHSCDLILSDFMLPQMSGLEFTKKVREQGIAAPIIIMTAHSTSKLALEAIRAGAYDFVIKPIHFPQLQVSIERALFLNEIKEENAMLKTVVASREAVAADGIIGKSPNFLKALDLAKRVSNSSASVLITGESGTGKEIIATAIHRFSGRRKERMVAINCSAIPETLLESELFGYVKGAFTGANEKKIGLFEEAHKGSLFLDEIGDLSLGLQAKLLRVLQERKIRRVGDTQSIPVDVRIISASHKNLKEEIAEKRFREDLYFRLNVIPINLPPLRDRTEDILPLARFFLRKYAGQGDKARDFSPEAVEYLIKNPWPGNVRELENTVERAVVLCGRPVVEAADLVFDEGATPFRSVDQSQLPSDLFFLPEKQILPLDAVINRYILFALQKNRGAKDKTARDLLIDRKTLYRRIKNREIQEASVANYPIDFAPYAASS